MIILRKILGVRSAIQMGILRSSTDLNKIIMIVFHDLVSQKTDGQTKMQQVHCIFQPTES